MGFTASFLMSTPKAEITFDDKGFVCFFIIVVVSAITIFFIFYWIYLNERDRLSEMKNPALLSPEDSDQANLQGVEQPQESKKSSDIVYTIFYVLIGGILAFGYLGSTFCSKHSHQGNDQADYEEEKAMAITMAKNFVKDRLKSPSSASFPWNFDEYHATKSSDGKWSMSGWVEAVNSFNGKLRIRWSLVMNRDGKNWALLSINIQD
jgi:hypothetical protein